MDPLRLSTVMLERSATSSSHVDATVLRRPATSSAMVYATIEATISSSETGSSNHHGSNLAGQQANAKRTTMYSHQRLFKCACPGGYVRVNGTKLIVNATISIRKVATAHMLSV